jgi:tetratricopeptide (TPR) repeat protein
MSQRQAAVLEELEEWREDLCGRSIGSRVVLVVAPAGWGRSAVLARFLDCAGGADGPVALVAGIDGNEPGDRAVQAAALQEKLAAVAPRSHAAELLDMDTPAGVAGLGLDVAGWFVPGLAAAVSLTGLSRLFGAAVRAWDDSPAGEAGAVARAAREVAALSVKVPVVVVLDDADLLDPGLARAVIGGLAGRYDGQVLVVATARPGGDLVAGLLKDPGPELAGRVCRAAAEPRMDYNDRVELAGELLPGLAVQAAERIGRRTAAFGEVFAAASAELLAGLAPGTGAAEAAAAADAVLDAVLERGVPSREAAVLAWARGSLHQAQADACLGVLGAERAGEDVHVRRAGRLACLADPASRRCAEQAAAFSGRQRAALAAAVLEAAERVAADSGAGLADRVVARQAVHRVRADLSPALRGGLPGVQRALIRGLEALGDPQAALLVARQALDETPPGDAGRPGLLAAYLRLARAWPGQGGTDPLAEEAVTAALAAGAAIGLEARVWAAADLLARDGARAQALALAAQVARELEAAASLGEAGDQWRLLLGFAAGRAGRPDLTHRLLAPLLASGTASREKPALAVSHAVDGPHADVRLQLILLQAELDTTPAAAHDDQLRLHAALAAAYNVLGIYPLALSHGAHELALRHRLQHPDHPDTLTTRNNVAHWTGRCGDGAGALRLLTALAPDQERVLGPDHPHTLGTRNDIAHWTGECGDAAGALRLSTALLPDQERVQGRDHPATLMTRVNIAHWTGECGDAAGALRLLTALLPDQERVLGPDHPHTLITRNNIAGWTGRCGDAAGALRLFTALLPDQERVLGPDHPKTQATRNNIAGLTEQLRHASRDDHEQLRVQLRKLADDAATAGDTATAISCCEQLMAAAEQALGPQDIRLTGYLRRVADILKAAGQDTLAIEALARAVTINDRYGSETTEAIGDLRRLAALQQRTGLRQEAAQYLDKARDIEARRPTGRA